MDAPKSDEQQQQLQNILNLSQKKRNRNKSNNQVKAEVDIAPEEIPIEEAMKAMNLASHQVLISFHFIFPFIIIMNV